MQRKPFKAGWRVKTSKALRRRPRSWPSRCSLADLPVVSGAVASKAFERAGWHFDRQSGSHMIYKKPGIALSLSIPNHKTLDRGLLRRLIKDAELSVDEFVRLLR